MGCVWALIQRLFREVKRALCRGRLMASSSSTGTLSQLVRESKARRAELVAENGALLHALKHTAHERELVL